MFRTSTVNRGCRKYLSPIQAAQKMQVKWQKYRAEGSLIWAFHPWEDEIRNIFFYSIIYSNLVQWLISDNYGWHVDDVKNLLYINLFCTRNAFEVIINFWYFSKMFGTSWNTYINLYTSSEWCRLQTKNKIADSFRCFAFHPPITTAWSFIPIPINRLKINWPFSVMRSSGYATPIHQWINIAPAELQNICC